MASCNSCGEAVGLPHTCKLCNNKYCSKHRLPERHDCVNLGYYKRPEYKQEKFAKEKELIEAKTMRIEYVNKNQITQGGFLARLFTIWTHPDNRMNLLIFGILATLSATAMYSRFFDVFLKINAPIFLVTAFTIATISAILLMNYRKKEAYKLGIESNFVFYKYFTWLLILFSLIGTSIIMIGKFDDTMGDLRDKAKLGRKNTVMMVSVWLIGTIISRLAFIIFEIRLAFLTVGSIFLSLAIFYYIPFGGFDGEYMLKDNKRNYIIGIIVLIGLYLFI